MGMPIKTLTAMQRALAGVKLIQKLHLNAWDCSWNKQTKP